MTSAESKPYAYTFLVTFTDALSARIIHDETVHLIITGSWFYLGRVLGCLQQILIRLLNPSYRG